MVERELSGVAGPIIKGVVMLHWHMINYYLGVNHDWTVVAHWDISEVLSSV